ncbi:hypothetical protein TNCV_1583951 [Trichonephila clavipes]|nr:hypothetical protein TNCV_1583951 [Trichonephila clavipes]
MIPEMAPSLLTTTPHQREDVSARDRFNVHCCPTRLVFSGTGLELMTCLPRSHTLTTGLPQLPVPFRHGDTLNNRRVANFLLKLVEEKQRWEAYDHPQGVFLQNWSGIEPNCTVTLVLKAMDNDWSTISSLP